jgi:Zn finger protein HypA/HybF involved in hydrogenase expression
MRQDCVNEDRFKLVCDNCGSLTIVLPNETESAPLVVLKCGRCGSPRGTLQALREMSIGISCFDA